MTYQTHALFSLVAAIIIIKTLSFLEISELSFLIESPFLTSGSIHFYLGLIGGSLLPDIDHINSKAGRKLWFIAKPLKLFGIKHRGLTHSLLGVVLFALLTRQLLINGWINSLAWYGIMLGYLSHLIADMFNPQGIPLFYPNQKRFDFKFQIATSSWKEHLFFLVLIIGLLLFFYRQKIELPFL